jgi:hypothetical protein
MLMRIGDAILKHFIGFQILEIAALQSHVLLRRLHGHVHLNATATYLNQIGCICSPAPSHNI